MEYFPNIGIIKVCLKIQVSLGMMLQIWNIILMHLTNDMNYESFFPNRMQNTENLYFCHNDLFKISLSVVSILYIFSIRWKIRIQISYEYKYLLCTVST